MDAKILIVDDEPPILELLVYNFKRASYTVLTARNGEEALAVARRDQPDLIILDIMLPKLDGLEVCRRLRQERDVPIIMLTARDSEVDRVVGLELGADDYVVKPFSVRELLARVKNVLRRTAAPAEAAGQPVRVGGLWMDDRTHEARWQEQPLELTALEFDLLLTLGLHPNQVFSREKLLEQVWGYNYYGDARVVDAAVKRLRYKFAQVADQPDPIATVRGVGYKLSG